MNLNVEVQSLSIAEDACTISTAKALVMSQSSFSRSLALFNEQFSATRLFEPLPMRAPLVSYGLHPKEYFESVCEAVAATTFYDFPGIEHVVTNSATEDTDFLVNYPKENIAICSCSEGFFAH